MEDLIKKLQNEVGITEEQAAKAINLVKGQIETGSFDIDWDKLAKGKYEDILSKAKGLFGEASDEATKFSDSLADKADDLADTAKEKLKEMSQKAAHFFDSDDEKA